MTARTLIIDGSSGLPQGIGRYWWKLEDVRQRTKAYVRDLTSDQLSFHPNPRVESIGTILLHIAAVEYSYIQEDILRKSMGDEWKIAFPIRFGIPQVSGKPRDFYIDKLDEVRSETLKLLKKLTDADLNRIVSPLEPGDPSMGPVEYSIEWILYHLIEHESHHKGQIAVTKRLLP